MTTEPKYTDAQLEKVAIRLDELVIAVADWRIEEFTMRIPAEPDRDADLVMQRAARMLRSLLSERQAAMQGQGGDRNDIVNAIMRDACEADRDHPDDPETVCIAAPALRLIVERHIIDAIQPPQPVRSVSDEDAKDAADLYLKLRYEKNISVMEGMRAALEHFAAIAQEKQS